MPAASASGMAGASTPWHSSSRLAGAGRCRGLHLEDAVHSMERATTPRGILDGIISLCHGSQERDQVTILVAAVFVKRHHHSIGARVMDAGSQEF